MTMSEFQNAVYAAETSCRDNYKQVTEMIKNQIQENNKDRERRDQPRDFPTHGRAPCFRDSVTSPSYVWKSLCRGTL